MAENEEMVERVARAICMERQDRAMKTMPRISQDNFRMEARAAIAAANQWRPISTAPRDGSKILALCQPRYVETGEPMPFDYINVVWWREGRFKHSLNGSYAEPTHWQALPSPPEGPET